jgi:hypothetical protein
MESVQVTTSIKTSSIFRRFSQSDQFDSSKLAMLPSCRLLLSVPILAGIVGACALINPTPAPEVSVTQLRPSDRPPKGSECHIPVLYREPVGSTKIAIVEVWGTEEQRNDLMNAVEKKGCELGADSLLVVSDTAQSTTHLVYDPVDQQSGEEGNGSLKDTKGDAIIRKEHVAKIGESGHSGYYIETYAIVLPDAKK